MPTPQEFSSNKSSAETIAMQLLLFPAFNDAKKVKRSMTELFELILDAYEQEQLTEEQDLVFEGLLYLYNLTEDFDLRRALTLWDEGDVTQYLAICREFHNSRPNTRSGIR